MSSQKTTANNRSVESFINSIDDSTKKEDSKRLVAIMQKVTKETPKMWGTSIIGFGSIHYKYASGREGDTVKVGFSPRKQALVLYGLIFYDHNRSALNNLGTYTTGKGCLYIKKLADVDLKVLESLISKAFNKKTPLESS